MFGVPKGKAIMIPEHVIQQVLERNDIVPTIQGYIPLKRAGRNFKANCPFHNEKSPSFVVNPDKQIFHCFGCGVGGNVFAFVMRQEHLTFPEAVEMLAKKVGIEIPRENDEQFKARASIRQQILDANEKATTFFHQQLMTSLAPAAKNAREYLKSRRVTLELVKQFRLGFAPEAWDGLLNYLRQQDVPLHLMEKAGLIIAREGKEGYYDRFRNRITFPIFDQRGHCVAFGARALEKDASAKYINSPETPVYTKGQHLYGFHLSKEFVGRQDAAVVVEGYMDFLMPFQSGVSNIVASLGTALTVEQIRLVHRFTENVVMLFDADPAGEAAMIRSLDLLIEEGMNVKVATLAPGEDPDSFVGKWGGDALAERVAQAQSLFDYKLAYLQNKFTGQSVESKAKVSKEMLATIAKFPNEVVRAGYLKRLSEELGIPQAALFAELQKAGGIASGKSDEVIKRQPAVGSVAIRAVEHNILKLLLHEEELISLTRTEVSVEDFQDERIRRVMNQIFSLFDAGQRVNVSALLNSVEEEGVRNMLSQVAAEEFGQDGLEVDKARLHRDCLLRLRTDKLKSVRQDLIEKIRQAEGQGDLKRLEELKAQFNSLLKKAIA